VSIARLLDRFGGKPEFTEHPPHLRQCERRVKRLFEQLPLVIICPPGMFCKDTGDQFGIPRAEQVEYLASYGLTDSGLERLITATYSLLGLMSFLTAGEDECRAWTIPMNSTAPKAAGAIHSDFEKKFIRAEVVNWKALVEHNGYPGVRDKGLLRLEGKEYIVKDGDVLVIRHS